MGHVALGLGHRVVDRRPDERVQEGHGVLAEQHLDAVELVGDLARLIDSECGDLGAGGKPRPVS
jgi:hypothetical protein